jgi:hypothetical protein
LVALLSSRPPLRRPSPRGRRGDAVRRAMPAAPRPSILPFYPCRVSLHRPHSSKSSRVLVVERRRKSAAMEKTQTRSAPDSSSCWLARGRCLVWIVGVGEESMGQAAAAAPLPRARLPCRGCLSSCCSRRSAWGTADRQARSPPRPWPAPPRLSSPQPRPLFSPSFLRSSSSYHFF